MTDETRMQFIQMSRAYYKSQMREDIEEEINISKEHIESGHEWGFSIVWRSLGGQSVPRLEIFDDAWIAFAEIPELFELFRDYDTSKRDEKTPLTPKRLCVELLGMGLVDATPEHPPGVGEKPTFDEERSEWQNVPRRTTVTDDWTVLVLDNGRKILTFGSSAKILVAKGHAAGDSVHVLNEHNVEECSWDNLEWREAPQEVMGAILRLAGNTA